MSQKYSILLFDADDTLFDYKKAELAALHNTFKKFHLPLDDDILALYKQINQQLWDAFEKGEVTKEKLKLQRFAQLFEALQIFCDVESFSNAYLTELGKGTYLLDNAYKVCEYLAAKYHLAIVSNGIHNVQTARFEASEIKPFFNELFTSEAIGYQKPEKEFFSTVFKKMNITESMKKEVLLIGDSLSADIKGGMNIGIDTCWFNINNEYNTLPLAPTYEIKQLSDLQKIL